MENSMRVGKSGFEIETCGRCGGSGRYSYNQIDGDRCYGCGGTGVRNTKRGKAARAYFEASLLRPVLDVQIGEFVRDAISGKWAQVIDITRDGSAAIINGERVPYVCIVTTSLSHGVMPDSQIASVVSDDDLRAKKAAALVYQLTLTKAGTVRAAKSAKADSAQAVNS